MSVTIPKLPFPELFIGFVAPVGTELTDPIKSFGDYFIAKGYNVINIKVTSVFNELKKHLKPNEELVDSPIDKRYLSHIKYGNQIRQFYDDDSALAAITLARIMHIREKTSSSNFEKNVYLIDQFKRPEEVELFRSVYGRLFFQVSVYSRKGARLETLAKRIAQSKNSAHSSGFRGAAEHIMSMDEHESTETHGQRVSKIFHDGDLILNTDITSPTFKQQVERFCDLIFGSNQISPSKLEYGMFTAKAAALRTLDLSRQVGAAIFTEDGEIISLGSNEVPKANGGTYWGDENFDDREFKRKEDSNDKRKNELLSELISILSSDESILNQMKEKCDASQFMDALEYGRIIHAEMSALCDAARLGRSIKSTILFSTTFPCHMCAKHIVASGIKKVVFLEPYPKSLAADLHSDSIEIEGADRGRYAGFPYVEFVHFFGISPRRYREIFERGARKDKKTGKFKEWQADYPQPIFDIKVALYPRLEAIIAEEFVNKYLDIIGASEETISA